MLRHTIILSLRALWKNKFHSILNILGLAIGISACLVIYLIVTHELSFNKGIPENDRIYRIHSQFSGAFSGLNRGAPTATAGYVRDNFKGIEKVSLFFCFGSKVEIPRADQNLNFEERQKVVIAGPEFFEVFKGFEFIAGSPDVLSRPMQIILTESQARKYFGTEEVTSAVGKEVIYRDSLVTTVGGIVRDLSFQADIDFTDFISLSTIEASWLKNNSGYKLNDWPSTNSSTQIFVKVHPGTTEKQLRDQLPQLSKMHADNSSWNATNHFNIQPLSNLHFNAETGIFDFSREPAHLPTLMVLIVVGALLLVIGAINFINLATAQSVRRAKEVGVRKVLGGNRTGLIIQFLCEGLALTMVAVVLALPLSEFGLSFFSEFVPGGVKLELGSFIPFFFIVMFFIGILASAYPAFVLSSFLPALALKNQSQVNSSQSRTAYLRKILIVFQFTVAQVLIIGTLMVAWQVRYLLNKDLGFKKDAVIYFDTPWWDKPEKAQLLGSEIRLLPEIEEVALSESPPSYGGWSSSSIKFNTGKEVIDVNAFRKFCDTAYVKFYGIELLAGRNLSHSDTVREFVINETLMRRLEIGSPQEAIGQTITYGDFEIPIVGVVKDFHIQSLHKVVEPVMMANTMKEFTCFNIRFNAAQRSGEKLQSSLARLEESWKKIYPDAPFRYVFLDETIKNFYQSERKVSKLSQTATGLAIFISCLGLFGLVSFTTTQRIKEIGIRKVFGASVREILFLLSRDFIVLVIIAFILATPVAWLVVNNWLEGYTYRTEINYWLFGFTIVVAVIIAFLTVSFQTIAAANKNPVESLRSE